ncbi:OmpH family outer membrane protein [Candidatus Laterigemmans baculatus]|uniref:OmpH family outer membrane protein n=1 Tax=Candidatus Laterigemmans baculatus TaxID=2770505 RepID=UPI001F31C138|nr:OmpH family outer membrane protein [Candidatus Laterigemmans baculatus]
MRTTRSTAIVFGLLAASVLTPNAAPAQEGSAAPHKIAVVDVARILKDHPGIKAQVQKVETDLKNYDQQLTAQREELKQAVELLKTFNVDSPEYRQQEEKIAQSESQLRLEMNRKRKELVDAEARIYFDNYRLISETVRQIAEYNHIDLVLRYNGEEMELEKQESVIRGVMKNIVYRSDRLDMTDAVINVLNQKLGVANAPAAQTRR